MPLYTKHRQLISRSRRLIQIGTAMTAALIIAAAAAIFMLRQGAIADAQDDNHRLGVVIAEQTNRTIQSVDLVLQEFVDKVASAGNGSAGHLNELFGGRDVYEALTKRLIDLPQAEAFTLLDATGHIVNVTRQWPPPGYSLAERDYFQYFAKTPDPAPYLTAPAVSRSSGAPTIFLVRRLTAPDGSFLGTIGAPILLSYFDSVLARAGFTDGTAVTILRSDGSVLVRFPSHGVAAGSHLKPNTAWHDAVASGGGQYVSPGLLNDAMPSFVSVHPIANYPVVVDVSRSKTAALARWWRQSLAIFLGVAAAALSQAMLLKTLGRQMTLIEESHHRIDEQVAIIRASEKRLAGQTDLLETTLRHMNQGLVMVDAEGAIAICNRRAMELLDLPAEMMENHPRAADVIAFQTQRGDFEAPTELKADPALLLSNDATYERQRPDGTIIEIHSVPLPDGGLVRTYTDITVRAATEKMLGHAASHDPLTGLANRTGFAQRLDAALAKAQQSSTRLALLCLDLDRFKAVNDRLGHAAGDQLLILAADRMRACSRADDVVGRLGGDEFAIILPGASLAGAEHACQRLLDAVREPYALGEETACIGVSIGIAIYPTDGTDAERLHQSADSALYKAKEAGRNTWRAYVNENQQREAMHRLLQQDVRAAVSLKQFTLSYQPICNSITGEPAGFEALLRWNNPRLGEVPPMDIIPAAEQTNTIIPLDRWVIETACEEAAGWAVPLRVAVNLSPTQFQDSGLLGFTQDVLRRTGLPASRLEMEVSEGLLPQENESVVSTMHALRAMGVRVVLDDFGLTNSNLDYLQGLPFDAVKIDRTFLHALSIDRGARTMVEAILAMARRLGLDAVGEGVETPEQLSLLTHLQCKWVQGHLLGRPETGPRTQEYLRRLASRDLGVKDASYQQILSAAARIVTAEARV